MDRKWKIGIAGLSAVLCLVLALCDEASVVSVLAQPFDWIGRGLRTLSLSGSVGNWVAIGLYGLVCAGPLALLLRRKFEKEDALLPACSALLFYVMYIMVNPHRITPMMDQNFGKIILGGGVYSLLICWGILKLLRVSQESGSVQMYRALRIFLMICAAECVVAAFGVGIMELRSDLSAIRQANTMPGLNLLPTYGIRTAAFAVSAIEYSLIALVMAKGVKLLGAMEQDPYCEACVQAAEEVNRWCVRALGIITLSNMALNVAQALLLNRLHDVDISVNIPVMSMAVVFGAMALTRLLIQGKEIKDDNDLFV